VRTEGRDLRIFLKKGISLEDRNDISPSDCTNSDVGAGTMLDQERGKDGGHVCKGDDTPSGKENLLLKGC